MSKLKIKATLEPRGPAAALILSDEQVAKLADGKKTPPVKVTVNGHTFAGRIGRMRGENMLGFNKEVRAACAVEPGETIEATIELDSAERTVEIPPALAVAFRQDKAAKKLYDGLAYTHRKEFANWVAEAKKEETRDRRVEQALAMLHAGETRS